MQKFYKKKQEIQLKNVLDFLSKDSGNFNLELKIEDITPLEKAKKGDLSFLSINEISGNKYVEMIKNSEVSFCLIEKRNLHFLPPNIIGIEVDNPYISFIELYSKFYSEVVFEKKISENVIIHPTASVSDICQIEDGVVIGPNVTILNFVKIGKNSIIEANASLRFCSIGENTHIGCGAKIGQDGFGYIPQKKDGFPFIFKIPHFGGVEIGDNCYVGTNTCIDRGSFENTKIGSFVKIDNLCQIAHNVQIGSYVMIAGQAGIAGSAKIGNNVLVGAKVGIIGHIKIGDNSIIYAGSGVTKNFPENSKIFAAWPADFYENWLRKITFFNVVYKKTMKIKKFIEKNSSLKAKILRKLVKLVLK